ncbi:MAG: carboxypeptidase-like regulatory domain-containing protein [Candidatus Methanomethylicia archaeon]
MINFFSVYSAEIVEREQILYTGKYLDIGFLSYRYSGPYFVQAGKTIHVEWAADRFVSVYILNEIDWKSWIKIGSPTSYRISKTAQEGYVRFEVKYSDNFYIVVTGFAGSAARLYSWTEKLIWQERIAGTLRIIVKDASGNAISGVYVSASGRESRTGYTDFNGQITFTDLAPGQYTITLLKSGFQTTSVIATVQQDKESQVYITMQQISSLTIPFLGIVLLVLAAVLIATFILYKKGVIM